MLNQRSRIIYFCLLTFSSVLAFNFQFNENGDFKILQFTDFHFGETTEFDQQTLALQRKMIERVKPDLIVMSGDGVGGYNGYILHLFTDAGWFERNWRQFTAPFVEAKIPYAFILGNHDSEADLSQDEIVKLDKTNPYSVLGNKDTESLAGTDNYYIPIHSKNDANKMVANIWMFDTGVWECDGTKNSYGCIEQHQIDWYNEMSDKLKEQHGDNVHHIAFIHIPLPEYQEVYNHEKIYGHANEGIACPSVNSGFFEAVKQNGNINAIFAGHDHDNDFGGFYQGIELAYGRKSGYGSYGSLHGVRVIEMKETVDGSGVSTVTKKHYVIDADGSIETTDNMEYRTGPKQLQGPSVGEVPFLKLRYMRVYDFILLALVAIATIVLGVFQWKRNYMKKWT